ncbi:MAG: hypothetical protein LUG60_07645 [Erysipelotrichaceae bacterium]|nr:hypothetical protein [Erysipelotrichaceae bacterium]
MKILICVKDKKSQIKIIRLIQLMKCEEKVDLECRATLHVKKWKYNIAFIDLGMDNHRAFKLGRKLYKLNHCATFYMFKDFTYIHEFFHAGGFHRILNDGEPLDLEKLKCAYEYYLCVSCKVVLKVHNKNFMFNPSHIQYIEHYKRYMMIVIERNRYKGFIENYEIIMKRLKIFHFFPSHPHYYLNPRFILEYQFHKIWMHNNDYLPTTLRNIDIKRAVMEAADSF